MTLKFNTKTRVSLETENSCLPYSVYYGKNMVKRFFNFDEALLFYDVVQYEA